MYNNFRFLPSLVNWERDIENFFDSFHSNSFGFPSDDKFLAVKPAYEILEDEKFYKISMDVPGLKKEDVEVEVRDNVLFVKGERKYEGETKSGNVIRNERRYGKFSRTFTLPRNANLDGVEASFSNGVLDIKVPKEEEKSQSKKISII